MKNNHQTNGLTDVLEDIIKKCQMYFKDCNININVNTSSTPQSNPPSTDEVHQPQSSDDDNNSISMNRMSSAIERTADRVRICYKNEYMAIYQIIAERQFFGNMTKSEFCRIASKCNVPIKPNDSDFKKILIKGNYPYWSVDNGKTNRFLEIASTFLEEMKD